MSSMYSVAIVVCLFVLLAAGYSISGYNRHYISKRNGYCNSKSSVGTLHASSRSKSKSAAIIDYDASQVGYGYDISESFEEISSLNPIPQFLKAVESSLYSDTSGYSFIKIVLSDNKRISDDESSVKDIKLITGRLIQLKKGLHLQLTYKYLTNDQMKNYSVDDIPSIVGDIEKYVKNGFKRAVLSTKKNVYELNMKRGSGKFRYNPFIDNKADAAAVTDNNDLSPSVTASNDMAIEPHDRKKNVLIDTNSPFLKALKITTFEGRPKANMYDKLRQIQKFVEILANLVDNVYSNNSDSDSNSNSGNGSERSLNIVDMGCGLGYLTFAIHQYFSSINAFIEVHTIGIETRAKLVKDTNAIATTLGAPFSKLSFIEGTIEEYSMRSLESVDILVALHACDTATDDAIYAGIKKGAKIIVTSPCCHKEIRKQIDASMSKSSNGNDSAVYDVLRYGIYRDRMSEMVTDTLRGLMLELAGYSVNIFEFIGGEHTSKNVMITAIKIDNDDSSSSSNSSGLKNAKRQEEVMSKINALMDSFGIKNHKLLELTRQLTSNTGSDDNSAATGISAVPILPLGRKKKSI